MIRIFTLEYDPIKKSFDDSALSTFLAGKSVISIEKRFFKQNSRFFWTFAIEYETEKMRLCLCCNNQNKKESKY